MSYNRKTETDRFTAADVQDDKEAKKSVARRTRKKSNNEMQDSRKDAEDAKNSEPREHEKYLKRGEAAEQAGSREILEFLFCF